MRPLKDKTNVEAPDGDFPFGRLRDDDGTGNGTRVDENAYGDIHQFFEKLMDAAGVVPNGLPDNAYQGFQLVEALLKFFHESGGHIKTKTVEIGPWDMQGSSTTNVLHGLVDHKKIRPPVLALVRNDADTVYQPLDSINAISGAPEASVGLIRADGSGGIQLFRVGGGQYDSANYNDTSFNRGYVVFNYLDDDHTL